MNNFNLPDDKKDALLGMLGQKLGQDPKQLQQQLEAGKLDNIMGNMDPKAAGQVNQLLQNPKALEAMLSNEKVKNMIAGLLKGQQ